ADPKDQCPTGSRAPGRHRLSDGTAKSPRPCSRMIPMADYRDGKDDVRDCANRFAARNAGVSVAVLRAGDGLGGDRGYPPPAHGVATSPAQGQVTAGAQVPGRRFADRPRGPGARAPGDPRDRIGRHVTERTLPSRVEVAAMRSGDQRADKIRRSLFRGEPARTFLY